MKAPSSQSSSSLPESSSEPESIVESEVSSEPESSVPESSSEPESVVESESSEPETEPVDAQVNESKGISWWLWVVIGLGVLAIGAGVALYMLGKKKLDD